MSDAKKQKIRISYRSESSSGAVGRRVHTRSNQKDGERQKVDARCFALKKNSTVFSCLRSREDCCYNAGSRRCALKRRLGLHEAIGCDAAQVAV